jgi:hypothetical protein
MFQKRKRQSVGFPDSLQAVFNCRHNFVEIFRTSICQFLTFDVSPQRLDRVHLWRVSWQRFNSEPTALAIQVFLHHLTLVCREPVPYQDCLFTAQVSLQILEESNQTF